MRPFSSIEHTATLPDASCESSTIPTTVRVPVDLGDLDMRVARNGSWYYRGSLISRKSLVKLFASVLTKESDGAYYIVTPAERGRIEIEDAPFVAVALLYEGHGQCQKLTFRTNLGEHVTADADHPIRVVYDNSSGEPSPYVLVHKTLEALIARSVYYDLVELGEESPSDRSVFGVWSCGTFFPLGNL